MPRLKYRCVLAYLGERPKPATRPHNTLTNYDLQKVLLYLFFLQKVLFYLTIFPVVGILALQHPGLRSYSMRATASNSFVGLVVAAFI